VPVWSRTVASRQIPATHPSGSYSRGPVRFVTARWRWPREAPPTSGSRPPAREARSPSTGARGFDAPSSSPTLADCTIRVASGHGGNTAVSFGSSSTAPSITNCLLKCPGGWGLELLKGSADHCTVDSTGTGAFLSDGDVSNSIVVGDDYGFYRLEAGHGTAIYCIAPGENGYDPSGVKGIGSKNEDPLFCAVDPKEYTLRVDSWGNAENNENDRIGAFEVACLADTLVRDASFTVGGTLAMLRTTTVDSVTSLTLGPGTTVEVTKTSPTAHLTVNGTLIVDGDDGDPVVFGSADGSPTAGDWYGIEVLTGAKSFIEYAEIRDGVYGAVCATVDTVTIGYSLFENNQTTDIVTGEIASPHYVGIANNTIRMAGSI